MQHDIADFSQELQSLAFRLEIDQRAGARTNRFALPCHIELAFRHAMDFETIGTFLIHFGGTPVRWPRGKPTLNLVDASLTIEARSLY